MLIFADSLSSVKAIGELATKNQLVQRIQLGIHRIIENGKEVTLLWIPGHSGVAGNDRADKEAKLGALRNLQFIRVHGLVQKHKTINIRQVERRMEKYQTTPKTDKGRPG